MFCVSVRSVMFGCCFFFFFCFCVFFFFFFKQKTAYEMCGRDWSSDVCSSDLLYLCIIIFSYLLHLSGFTINPLFAITWHTRTMISVYYTRMKQQSSEVGPSVICSFISYVVKATHGQMITGHLVLIYDSQGDNLPQGSKFTSVWAFGNLPFHEILNNFSYWVIRIQILHTISSDKKRELSQSSLFAHVQ